MFLKKYILSFLVNLLFIHQELMEPGILIPYYFFHCIFRILLLVFVLGNAIKSASEEFFFNMGMS
jgi:hypothetical protein